MARNTATFEEVFTEAGIIPEWIERGVKMTEAKYQPIVTKNQELVTENRELVTENQELKRKLQETGIYS